MYISNLWFAFRFHHPQLRFSSIILFLIFKILIKTSWAWNYSNTLHFCDRLLEQKEISELYLQAMTTDGENLYLIENDLLYAIPLSNLDQDRNVLYMIDHATKRRMEPIGYWYDWIRFDRMSVSTATAQNIDAIERQRLRALHKLPLRRYQLVPTIRADDGSSTLHQHFTFANPNNDGLDVTLIYDFEREKIVFESKIDKSKRQSKSMTHRDFNAITDGQSVDRGYMFYYDIEQERQQQELATRRVMIGPMTDGNGPNYPLITIDNRGSTIERTANIPIGAYLHTNEQRSEANLQNAQSAIFEQERQKRRKMAAAKSGNAQNGDKKSIQTFPEDLFLTLPWGFASFNRVFLFSLPWKRVYWFPWTSISIDTSVVDPTIHLNSKPWHEFFQCEAKPPRHGSESEPSQSDYYQFFEQWKPPELSKSWNKTQLMIRLLLISIFIFSVVFAVCWFRADSTETGAAAELSAPLIGYGKQATISKRKKAALLKNGKIAKLLKLNHKAADASKSSSKGIAGFNLFGGTTRKTAKSNRNKAQRVAINTLSPLSKSKSDNFSNSKPKKTRPISMRTSPLEAISSSLTLAELPSFPPPPSIGITENDNK